MSADDRSVPESLSRPSAVRAQAVLNLTVFLSGASIMVLELAAGRIVAPHLGQSLYTWTAIIGLILAGISVGNYLGGRIADLSCSRAVLAVQFVLAASGCLTVLWVNAAVGSSGLFVALPLGIRIFLHVALVFVAPALLLGTISPVVARRALLLGRSTGVTMGNVYAWAIIGSVVGTLFTGYGLLNWVGVRAITAMTAVPLAALGAFYGFAARFGPRDALSSRPSSQNPLARSLSWEWSMPLLTVFLASVCVMALEIVAGRLIAWRFGQSLYGWTSVIGMVLAGMSLGSYLGGRLADRVDAVRLLCLLFAVGSATCLAFPLVMMAWDSVEGLRRLPMVWQIGLCTFLSFFAPSFALGAISPVAAKMALERGGDGGRTVGILYAIGAAGSIVGTLLAGCVLINAIGAIESLCFVSAVLWGLALCHSRHARSPLVWAAALVCLFSVLPGVRGALVVWTPDAFECVYSDESQYSAIAIEADKRNPSLRWIMLDALMHSTVDLDHPEDLKYQYEWVYASVLNACYPLDRPVRTLMIGGGGYTFPRYLELTRPDAYVEVAEIDPAVTAAAHAAFGLPRDTTIRTYLTDARNRVDELCRRLRAGEAVPRFDCIFGDAFNAYSVPYHLTTVEFNRRIKDLLKDDGLYMLNVIDILDSGQFLGAVANTCQQTFPNVCVFTVRSTPHLRSTFVIVCSMRPLDLDAVLGQLRAHPSYRGAVLTPDQVDDLIARADRRILTDDFAPVENLLLPVVRESVHVPGKERS